MINQMPLYVETSNKRWTRDAMKDSIHVCTAGPKEDFYCRTHGVDAAKCGLERDNDVIFGDFLDRGEYGVIVIRQEPYRAKLIVVRCTAVVLEKEVSVAYDAPFGPDISDILTWQELAREAADEDYCERGLIPPEA